MQNIWWLLDFRLAPQDTLEPGLLSVLRALVGVQLLLLPAALASFPPRTPIVAASDNVALVDILRTDSVTPIRAWGLPRGVCC